MLLQLQRHPLLLESDLMLLLHLIYFCLLLLHDFRELEFVMEIGALASFVSMLHHPLLPLCLVQVHGGPCLLWHLLGWCLVHTCLNRARLPHLT